MTERHCVRDGIREYLQVVYGVEIGKPLVKGEIVAEILVGLGVVESAMENGTWYRRNLACNIVGTVTCCYRRLLEDETEPLVFRVLSAGLLMSSRVGIRISELCALEAGVLEAMS